MSATRQKARGWTVKRTHWNVGGEGWATCGYTCVEDAQRYRDSLKVEAHVEEVQTTTRYRIVEVLSPRRKAGRGK